LVGFFRFWTVYGQMPKECLGKAGVAVRCDGWFIYLTVYL